MARGRWRGYAACFEVERGSVSITSSRRRHPPGCADATTSASSVRQLPQRVPARVHRMTSVTDAAPASTTLRTSWSVTASHTQTYILKLNIVFNTRSSSLKG
jgi:hypothetical protein